MSSEESRGTSRSGFLKQAAGATIVAAGAGVGAAAVAQQVSAASSASGRFSLEIDGVNVGMLGGVDGGDKGYAVGLDPVGSDSIQRKHVANIKWSDLSLQVGSGMGKAMYDWIQASFDKGSVRKSGAIVAADFNFKEIGRRNFFNALITEVTVPALDAASKEHGYFTVKVSAASVATVKPSGLTVHAPKQKAWLPSNFRFIVHGVDTTRVASIDSFTWKQSILADGSAVLDAGDFGVSFDVASLPSWQRWYNNFDVGGDATDERSGILELVGEDGTVLDLGLENLGLYRLLPTVNKRVKAEMYCERGGWDFIRARPGSL